MKNKRNPFTRLLSVVMLLSLCCLFTACPSDSEEKEDISSNELTSILRKSKWVNRDYYFDAGGAYAELSQTTDYYYFISDTEGILCHYYKWIDTSGIDDQGLDASYIFFTYTISGNRVSIKKEDGYSQSFVYDGEFLKSGNDYYRPVTPSAGDWEQIAKIKEKHKYEGDYEFEYFIGFDNSFPSVYEKGIYTHVITLGFVVPENTYIRGITEYGIAIYPTNGEISYKKGLKDGVWVEKKYVHGLQSICYIGTFSDNNEHTFTVNFTFTSTAKTAKFKYAPTFYTTKEGWKDGHNFIDYEYVPKNISGDDSWNNGNNNNNGNDNNGNNDTPSGSSHTGTANGHEWVDLGLPSGTKWASCNVGASKPEDYGDYYAWGETTTKSLYHWDSYKYGSSSSNVVDIGSDIAGTKYDVASVKWGENWRIPSLSQIEELLDNTTSVWTTQNGVNGRKFTGSNGFTIFLPAAGCRYDGSNNEPYYWDVGDRGEYWSSTMVEYTPYESWKLLFTSTVAFSYWEDRMEGRPVRPVR